MTLDDLRKIAEAATPGEWVRDGISVLGAREEHDLNTGLARLATMMMPWERERMEANAEFIATFDPQKVLELLDQIEMLEREHGEMTEVIEPQNEHIRELTKATYVQHARLAAVEEVHERREYWTETGEDICDTCSRRKQGDFVYWPCDTIKAARGE